VGEGGIFWKPFSGWLARCCAAAGRVPLPPLYIYTTTTNYTTPTSPTSPTYPLWQRVCRVWIKKEVPYCYYYLPVRRPFALDPGFPVNLMLLN
jgi:hypothetical protein